LHDPNSATRRHLCEHLAAGTKVAIGVIEISDEEANISFDWSHRMKANHVLWVVASVVLMSAPALAAGSWQSNYSYGGSGLTMDLYSPSTPAASPPIVVAIHYCSGNSGSTHGWFDSFADKYGFYVIAPNAGTNCFDAAPGRSGARANIVDMVKAVLKAKNGDATRVFAAGASSGACMTQALLASYPDVFAAGSSLAGVPVGAWNGGTAYGWSTSGVSGATAWGDKVRQADPGFSGTRPRVQLWQGQGDTTLTYSQTYPNEVAQWMNVFSLTDADGTKSSIKPTGAQDTWDRTTYKDKSGTVVLEANSGPSNVPHDLTGRGLWTDVVRFFGLDGNTTPAAHDGGVTPTGGEGGGGATGAGGAATSRDGGPVPGRDGGSAGTGGISTGAGGATGALGGGGVGSGTGGTTGVAGNPGSGGNGAGGASTGRGGADGTGGSQGKGGSPSGAGGAGSGGSVGGSGVGGSGTTSADTGSSGCGCALGAARTDTRSLEIALLVMGIVAFRRRRS
jgi:acetylxylan esterase